MSDRRTRATSLAKVWAHIACWANLARAAWALCGLQRATMGSSIARSHSSCRTVCGRVRASPSAWRASAIFWLSSTTRTFARLYDAGVTAVGQPYLALEYVEGVPITEFCRRHQLNVKQRLRKFLQVANAVAHAHGKLIVHRDLKPANILVTPEGQVRLLDFGIAKLIDEGGARDSALTEQAGRALTVDYASPEQIAGEPIAMASDVYSLGVIFYELLTERRPYAPSNSTRRALEDAILTIEPRRPSETTDERALQRVLRGDLDVIALRALKKNPDERYATVNAFADDIVRYLSGRPVLAQPDSAWYRCTKFIARNRVASGVGAALLAAVVGITILAADIVHSALADRRRTDIVNGVFASIFHEIDPARGGGVSLQALENILVDAERQAEVRLPADDSMRLRIETRLARVEHHRGKAGIAKERLRHVRDALERAGRRGTEEYLSPLLVSVSFAIEEQRWRDARDRSDRSPRSGDASRRRAAPAHCAGVVSARPRA